MEQSPALFERFFFKYIYFLHWFSAEAFLFAGCTTVLILAISARFMLKKKAPVDPFFYGMNSQMHGFAVFGFCLTFKSSYMYDE